MCCYIVATAGVRNSKGGIIYVVMANVVKTVYWDFNKSLFKAFHKELQAFYTVQSSAQLLEALQFLDLTKDDTNMLTSRWLFFRQLRCQIVKSQEVDEDMSDHSETFPFSFPPTTMFKSKFQIMYNSLKGGLDANTQQYISIQPPVQTKFEAKYIICMMIAIVTNAWRSYQLLSETVDIDTFTLSMFKKRLRNSGMPLQEFNYNLAIALIIIVPLIQIFLMGFFKLQLLMNLSPKQLSPLK
jgi:hypothetical protein